MAKAVTATDVAREAGVSQATVSYVINDSPNHRISPETRKRVLDAVERLGYRPSAAARALRLGTSDVVLLTLPDVPIGPAVADLMTSLAGEFEVYGYQLVTRRPAPHGHGAAHWRGIRPAAVIAFMGSLSESDEAELRAVDTPVFGIMERKPSPSDTTGAAQVVVGRLQVEHLAATGHVDIGYAAPDDTRVSAFFELRLEGVRQACLELGLPEPVIEEVALDADAGARAISRWRSRPDPVTAVCAYNDEVAFALLAGAHRLELAVPRDLAVIGVDDIPLAHLAQPPLTTIDQSVGLLASHVAQRVMAALRDEPAPPRLSSDTARLIIRESA